MPGKQKPPRYPKETKAWGMKTASSKRNPACLPEKEVTWTVFASFFLLFTKAFVILSPVEPVVASISSLRLGVLTPWDWGLLTNSSPFPHVLL